MLQDCYKDIDSGQICGNRPISRGFSEILTHSKEKGRRRWAVLSFIIKTVYFFSASPTHAMVSRCR